MVNEKEYYEDINSLYKEKEDADIYELLNFCKKYYGKLNVQHISSLMKLICGDSTVSEQNESIVKMLDKIVQMYGQEAVNSIVKNSDILIQENAEGELFIILAMILFWNEKLELDIVAPLKTVKYEVLALYKKCITNKITFVNAKHKELLQSIQDKLLLV